MLRFEPDDVSKSCNVFSDQLRIGQLLFADGEAIFFADENAPLFADSLRGVADELDRLNNVKS